MYKVGKVKPLKIGTELRQRGEALPEFTSWAPHIQDIYLRSGLVVKDDSVKPTSKPRKKAKKQVEAPVNDTPKTEEIPKDDEEPVEVIPEKE